jgi:3,4-dihydroxyphenylacetate 2,3-dioxygenase
MGTIVGAAIVSHSPSLMMPEAERFAAGAGRDSDLIAGFARLRRKLDAARPDTLVIFDTHWITTNMHVVAGAAQFRGVYTSDEMPHVLHGVAFDYPGAPDLARLVEEVARERDFAALNATDPHMANHYATLNLVAKLGRGEKVLSVGCCQNATLDHYLQMGEAIREAVTRSKARAALLASGALSHVMTVYDAPRKHPRVFHPDNVSDPRHVRLDREIIALFAEGRHDTVIERYPELRAAGYEGRGAHYLQMVGALGGRRCRARGTALSEYENARGTGNIHIWFDLADRAAAA